MNAYVIDVGAHPAVHPGTLRRHRAAGARSLPEVVQLAAVIVLALLGMFGLGVVAADLASVGGTPPEGPARGLDL